jgi:AraC family transcriptional regulator
VPASRYAVFTHDGPIDAIRQTWDAIHREWLPSTTLQPANAPAFERYDTRYNAAAKSGIVEIWFPVVARR